MPFGASSEAYGASHLLHCVSKVLQSNLKLFYIVEEIVTELEKLAFLLHTNIYVRLKVHESKFELTNTTIGEGCQPYNDNFDDIDCYKVKYKRQDSEKRLFYIESHGGEPEVVESMDT